MTFQVVVKNKTNWTPDQFNQLDTGSITLTNAVGQTYILDTLDREISWDFPKIITMRVQSNLNELKEIFDGDNWDLPLTTLWSKDHKITGEIYLGIEDVENEKFDAMLDSVELQCFNKGNLSIIKLGLE